MNSTRLILVRHGETEWNLEGKIQGCTDVPLSSNGKLQGEEVSRRLEGKFDMIYSSPLQRAHNTAKSISNGKIEVILDDKMKEIPFGDWEGKTFEELDDENYAKFVRGEDGMPLANTGFSIKFWMDKNAELLDQICQLHKGKKILIVSHGAWIKCAILGLLKLEPKTYHHIKLGNTGISTFSFTYGYPILESFNETSHASLGNRSLTG